MLAISLHATNDALRDELVPLNRRYPIADLLAAVRDYPGLSNARRVTFEYVMLKGINDSPAEAHALVRLLAGIPAKINLIPFNPWPGSPYACSDRRTIETFADIVNRAGYASPIRRPRGRDIQGRVRSAEIAEREAARQRASAAERPDRLMHLFGAPVLQAWATGFPITLLHVLAALIILAAGAAVYALITPHREVALIRDGNAAAALSLGGVLVGLALPLAASLAASVSLPEIALWGATTVFVQLAVFRLTDLALRDLPARIARGEMAAAALLVGAKIATAVVLAAAVSA